MRQIEQRAHGAIHTSLHTTRLAVFALCFLGSISVLRAAPPEQKMFASPAEASSAVFRAAEADDTATLVNIFGADAKDILFSGDAAEDKNSREQFVRKYEEMHRVVEESDETVRLYIGAENWPMPVPLVKQDAGWHFDARAGKEEIRFRQIGRNEIVGMRVLQALVDAQKEYYAESPDGEAQHYARQFVSDEGTHNGLYWNIARGESESPIGLHLAYAGLDNVRAKPGTKPFYGYYFKILNRQGDHAPGGTMNYIVDGKLTEGFAFLAYPAEYGTTGVMSIIVGEDAVLYQKDLGPRTAEVAGTMHEYNPDKTWMPVE